MRNSLLIKHSLNQIFLKILATLALALPTAFLFSVVSLSLWGKPYSMRDVLLFTGFYAAFLFWFVWLVINRYLCLKPPSKMNEFHGFFKRNALITVLFPFLLLVGMFTWVLFNVEDVQGVDYLPPNYKYQIRISPLGINNGDICIGEIQNSRGMGFVFNDAVRDLNISREWQQDINGCLFFLENGNEGEIFFDYVGAIDDTLRIDYPVQPGGGTFYISSSPGREMEISLSSEKNSDRSTQFGLGTRLLRNITDWGVLAGLFSTAIIISVIISVIEKGWDLDNKTKPYTEKPTCKDSKIFINIHISEKSALLLLFLIFVIASWATFLITKPLAYGPSHFGDETIYWETAFNLYKGSYSPSQFKLAPPFYPISLLPAFFLLYPENAYLGAKVLNAFYLSSAIFPAYFLLRLFVDRKKAILASLLFVINPAQLIFQPRILSENLFLPLLLWALYFGFKNIYATKTGKIFSNIFFGIFISLLFLTRYIGLVLIPAFFIIWWIKPVDVSIPNLLSIIKIKIKSFIWVVIPMGIILGSWMAIGLADGLSLKETLGFISVPGVSPNPEQLTLFRLFMWGVFYTSYVILLAGPYGAIIYSTILDHQNIDSEKRRWLLTILILVVFLLIACIRHSWRADYNFPVPLKLQGRYIFFLNHLFLITAAISFFNNHVLVKRAKILIHSALLVAVAYSIINIGFIFLNYALKASVSSPNARFMEALGPGFLTITILFILLFATLPFKSPISKTLLFIFLLGFFSAGVFGVFRNEKKEYSQLYNSQIYHLITDGFSQCDNFDVVGDIKISYDEQVEDWVLRYWRESLNFYGLHEVELELNPIHFPVKYQFPTFYAEKGNCRIRLRYLHDKDYQASHNPKFSYNAHDFFDFQLVE